MAYGFRDFDLRQVPSPRLVVGGRVTKSYSRSYSSVLGLAVDNLVKWLVWSEAERCISFDAVADHARVEPVAQRLLYPRHLRYAGRWLERLGMAPRLGAPGQDRPLDREEIAKRRSEWDRHWLNEVATEIITPLRHGRLCAVSDEALARFITEFIWSPRLRGAPSELNEAVGQLRGILSRLDVQQLKARLALIDPNFGFDSGDHYLTTALEADLLLDTRLVDIKLTSPRVLSRRIFEDMIRYFLCFSLHTFSETRGSQLPLWQRVPPRIEIAKIGLFVADRGALMVWDRREWLSDTKLDELRAMYASGKWIHAERHQARSRAQQQLFDSKPPLK